MWQEWGESPSAVAVAVPRIQRPEYVYRGAADSHWNGQGCDLVEQDRAEPGVRVVVFACGCVGRVPGSAIKKA
jgi:hypothetical protein